MNSTSFYFDSLLELNLLTFFWIQCLILEMNFKAGRLCLKCCDIGDTQQIRSVLLFLDKVSLKHLVKTLSGDCSQRTFPLRAERSRVYERVLKLYVANFLANDCAENDVTGSSFLAGATACSDPQS
jgi:hypothetical protein